MAEYWRYREPYLPAFFVRAAEAMQLSRTHQLLDIACGTGVVAFGFAPFVGSLTGVDVDQQALRIARAEAGQQKINIDLIHAGIEDLPDNGAQFDLVTIGRAHSYLNREVTLARLESLVSARGWVLLCGSTTNDSLSGQWASAFRATRLRWSRREDGMRNREFMTGSAFSFESRLIARRRNSPVSVADLLLRALSYSTLMPEALALRRDEYLEDIRSTVSPFAVEGMLSETIETSGSIFRRTNS